MFYFHGVNTRTWLFLFVVSGLCLACKGRLPLTASFQDRFGHELFLFEDSIFYARVGNDGEQFYRRSQHAFGRYLVDLDGTLLLRSSWDRQVSATIVPDTVKMTEGFAIRLVDRSGYSNLTFDPWLSVYDQRDSLLQFSYGYGCFFSDRWSPWVRIEDPWDMIEIDTVWLPDSGKRWNTVKLDLWTADHYGTLIVLKDLELRREGENYVPDRPYSGAKLQDPQLDTLVPWKPEDKQYLRSMERKGLELKRSGRVW